MSSDGEVVLTVDLKDEGALRVPVERDLANRIQATAERFDAPLGHLWTVGQRRFGDDLKAGNRPDLYRHCEDTREAQREWIRNVLEAIVEHLEDGTGLGTDTDHHDTITNTHHGG